MEEGEETGPSGLVYILNVISLLSSLDYSELKIEMSALSLSLRTPGWLLMKFELKWEFCPSSSTLHHLIATGQIYEDEKDIILDKTDFIQNPDFRAF